ncbi:MAG: sterol desaturase family protein [Myxococcales bacterium]|nr:sterol desaturase family protein [Myxococcales bacterium]
MARLFSVVVVLTALFWLLERRYRPTWPPDDPQDPSAARRLGLRRDTRTDLLYWLFTPLVTKTITSGALVVAVFVLASAKGVHVDRASGIGPLLAGSPILGQPRWLQGIEALVLLDFTGYWIHRLFHRGRLWRFHAVHHSSRRLTWLSAARLHPINDLLTRLVQVIGLLLLGFDPMVLAGVVPFTNFYALLLHARLPWDYGRLRYVIASPAFHRWHHTSEAEGCDKNFAGFLPIWDLLFGTFFMPRDRPPIRFGVTGERVPEGLLAQLWWPFRAPAPVTATGSEAPPQGRAAPG